MAAIAYLQLENVLNVDTLRDRLIVNMAVLLSKNAEHSPDD